MCVCVVINRNTKNFTKSIHDIGPQCLHDTFTFKETMYDFRNDMLDLSMYNTIKYGRDSTLYDCPRLWNTVHKDLKHTYSCRI